MEDHCFLCDESWTATCGRCDKFICDEHKRTDLGDVWCSDCWSEIVRQRADQYSRKFTETPISSILGRT